MHCDRCNACLGQWDTTPCARCNWPDEDTRTPEQRAQDEDYFERLLENIRQQDADKAAYYHEKYGN